MSIIARFGTPDTAVPPATAVQVGNAATEGMATSLSRSDHQHAVTRGTPVDIGVTNAEGTSKTFVSSDHVHAGLTRGPNDYAGFTAKTIPGAADLILVEDSEAAGVKKQVTLKNATSVILSGVHPVDITRSAAQEGSAVEASRQDHKHDISTAVPLAIQVGNTAAEGTAASLARSDHQHAVAAGTPVSIGSANLEGTATTFARADHVHAGPLPSSTAPVNVTKAIAAAGISSRASRQDHKHDVATEAPVAGAVQIGNTATEGSAISLARSDHQHAVTGGAPVTIGVSNIEGMAVTFARSDHIHAGAFNINNCILSVIGGLVYDNAEIVVMKA